MDTSTYFGLNLVTGADKVNPLTVDRPNYEKIDEQMHKNQIASVLEATELKSGTVHAITCLTEGAVFFRFTATSDYAAGDTFTFNGTPVSAVLPDGSGLQQGAFKINGTVLCSIIGTLLTVYSFTASGIAADSEKLGGQLPAYYAKATDAISTYIHSRIGTVNNFVGNGANGKVKIVANIEPGDTVQVNGQTVTAYAGASDFVETFAGEDLVGKTLFFIYDSTSNILNFNGGGGLSASDRAKLVPENIRAGVTIANVVGNLIPSTQGNSLACVWTRVYDNANAPIYSNNVTGEAPISINGTTIRVTRNFTAFVQKFPFKNANGSNGSSNIPEGQVNFTEGETFNVSVSVPHGNNNMSGLMLLFVVNG